MFWKSPTMCKRLCVLSFSRIFMISWFVAYIFCYHYIVDSFSKTFDFGKTQNPGPAKDFPPGNPCRGRPTPIPIHARRTSPPSLYFLHIPKTAGTLAYKAVLQYANKTNGLACQFLYDGNRWNVSHYQMGIKPPPPFPVGSLERKAVAAYSSENHKEKYKLYERGACRSIRGHVTFAQRNAIKAPVISFTILRPPLERFVSMYEFVQMMVSSRPGQSGWDPLLSSASIEKALWNSSSIINKGFYDEAGQWIAKHNVGFSFHFYGVLHQLSGITPVFAGVGDTSSFRMSNAAEMAEIAKDNICSTHILGLQSNIPETFDLFFHKLSPYAQWTEKQKASMKEKSANVNKSRKSRDLSFHLSEQARKELERRLQHEIEVYKFGERVVSYRKRCKRSRG